MAVAQPTAMRAADRGFWRVEISGAKLDCARAQCERSRDAPPVADATGRDHWHRHRIDDLREQREQAHRFCRIGAEEPPGMPAGLKSLGDDSIGPPPLKPTRLLGCRRIAKDNCASGLNPIEQLLIWQAEMEADDFGPDLLDNPAHRIVDRQAKRSTIARLHRELVIIGLEQRAPRTLVGILRHSVAEEIEVERAGLP